MTMAKPASFTPAEEREIARLSLHMSAVAARQAILERRFKPAARRLPVPARSV